MTFMLLPLSRGTSSLQISALRGSITVESAFLCEQRVNEEKGKMHFQINIWEYLREALL